MRLSSLLGQINSGRHCGPALRPAPARPQPAPHTPGPRWGSHRGRSRGALAAAGAAGPPGCAVPRRAGGCGGWREWRCCAWAAPSARCYTASASWPSPWSRSLAAAAATGRPETPPRPAPGGRQGARAEARRGPRGRRRGGQGRARAVIPAAFLRGGPGGAGARWSPSRPRAERGRGSPRLRGAGRAAAPRPGRRFRGQRAVVSLLSHPAPRGPGTGERWLGKPLTNKENFQEWRPRPPPARPRGAKAVPGCSLVGQGE